MAKNKARKNNTSGQTNHAKPSDESLNKIPVQTETLQDADPCTGEGAAPEKPAGKETEKQKKILYQVKTKRDSDVIKAYITFTYRVLHPTVSSRLVIYGLLIMLPGIFFFKDIFWRVFFIAVGALVILLGFFRQYISLWITKKNDPDYKSGSEYTYNFREADAEFLKNGERFLRLDKYKDITNFYYDDDFYYLAVRSRDFFVIPKKSFTIGDASEFEEFIYKKSKHTCRWIPDKFGDRMKKRRAQRTLAGKDLYSKDLFK